MIVYEINNGDCTMSWTEIILIKIGYEERRTARDLKEIQKVITVGIPIETVQLMRLK